MANRTSRRKVRASMILLILHALWDKICANSHTNKGFSTVTCFTASLFVTLLWNKISINYGLERMLAEKRNIFEISY